MKKIIPFKKDIKFNTKIFEITSISLEHNLTIESNNIITGEFVVSGDYKMNDSSINTEPFIHGLPFDITLDTKYDMDRIKIDIDDFKFEIINEEILRVNIDVLIEGIEITTLDEEEELDEITPDLIIEPRKEKIELDEESIKENLIDIGFENEEEEINQDICDNNINLEDIKVIDEKEMRDSVNPYVEKDLFKQGEEQIQAVSSDEAVTSIFNSFSEKDEKYVTYYVHIVRENDNIDSISAKYGVSIDEIKEYNNIDQITLGMKIIVPYTANETI